MAIKAADGGTGSLFPVLQYAHIEVPAASVLTLNSSPVTLITAPASNIIYPERAYVVKASGTAYTVSGVTGLQVLHSGSATTMFNWASALFGTFWSSTGETSLIADHQTNATYGPNANALVGTDLLLKTTGADPAAGTGSLHVYISYRVWPVAVRPSYQ